MLIEVLAWRCYLKSMALKEEMKILGHRKSSTGGLEQSNGFLKMVITLRGGKPFIPRGVYRFRSHEEKDEWILKMLTRPNPARPR
jgi:hypothetical protein